MKMHLRIEQSSSIRALWLFVSGCLGMAWSTSFSFGFTPQEAPPSLVRIERLAAEARLRGDAQRGAWLFHTSPAACSKCHAIDAEQPILGPNLADLGPAFSRVAIVESILQPSKSIRLGFETVAVLTMDGLVRTGILVEQGDERVVLRDFEQPEQTVSIPRANIEELRRSQRSLMPEGLEASIGNERDLLDLVRYIEEIAVGGVTRAHDLQPPAETLVVVDDTANLDHEGILRSLDQQDLVEGERIFRSECQQCHGADGSTPQLPTARAFGEQELKYGSDPYRMLLTLTKGAGLMPAMQHLSPRQRYQVIHFIREALMKPTNASYQAVDEPYLTSLPEGTSHGEAEDDNSPRDFGPVLASQIGNQINNALTFRAQDNLTFSYDVHRMRSAGLWEGGWLDLSQTHHYRQRGEGMPQIAGERVPGIDTWGWLYNEKFDLPQDAKPPRGPIRDDWLQYYGHYLYADRAIVSYGIQGRKVLESIETQQLDDMPLVRHSLHIAGSEQALTLCIGQLKPVRGSMLGTVGKDSPFNGAELLFSDGELNREQLEALPATTSADDMVLIFTGQAISDAGKPLMSNRARHVVQAPQATALDLGTPGRTIIARFRTSSDGTLIASTPPRGRWKPNGKTLFVRGGKLVFDIGWVGAMTGRSKVDDERWHTAALVVGKDTTRLFVDGRLEAEQADFRRPPALDHVLKIGATATDFGGDFAGSIDWIEIYPGELQATELQQIHTQGPPSKQEEAVFTWNGKPEEASLEKRGEPAGRLTVLAAGVAGDTQGCEWSIDAAGRVLLRIPGDRDDRVLTIARSAADVSRDAMAAYLRNGLEEPIHDPKDWTRGGPLRWPQRLEASGRLGDGVNGYALDTIPIPFSNPWNAWMRTSALDFLSDGRAVVCTHGGDVYLVGGLDQQLAQVVWKRFASGLFEPFGIRVLHDQIYVTCRDGIKRLYDFNGDDEVDFVEAFWIDDDLSNMFHAYNFDLQTDSQGSFYFAKAGQYTQHHRPGTIMRIPPTGGKAEVVAWGLRTPNGMGKLADDRFTVSDNQGPWMPAGKISLIKPNSFLGNMPINAEQDAWLKSRHAGQLPNSFEQPLVWTPQELDNSCGGQLWVSDQRFGPLAGHLLHSSFGKGRVYYLSLQEIEGNSQASIVSLPHQWDAGVMRLRVNPADGQVYGVGLSGWQGPAGGGDGCLQRLRYTGSPTQFVERTRVVSGGIELTFSFDIDPESCRQVEAWQAKMWDYLWSGRYGSDQFSVLRPGAVGQDMLAIEQVEVIDSRRLRLLIPELTSCDQLWLHMDFSAANGERFIEQLYMTIHALPSKED